ncbi:MAG: glycosyl hydrolase, partial [Bacteroidota bacterium]
DIDISALKLRNVGPAFSSGRIADIAIHPNNDNVWYVAVGSGGVWKTENAGTTWKPLFDRQASYSTGCITIDANDPSIIWVGTGENVGGRHVGFGDGIYKSTDSGKTWKNVGLKTSEHISEIIVHPDNSEVVYVAAQGPLWSEGGERGFYKTTDGGKTWNRTLGNDQWTGVTDIAIDPRDPNLMYAATWDRHRTVAAYMGGGPGSGIHRSTDGGETWTELKTGLPRTNMGKIGMAISPQQPDVLYAAIELDRATGGVWRSTDRGSSWTKMSDAVSGATGPHYYQELYASPHEFDKIYLMDVQIQVSDNGGKSFSRLPSSGKHSDNHAITFRADDPDYLLIGTDGGIYESFDGAKTWHYFDNLPIIQYYKVAVDDSEPFYNIYGGTQDNGSHGGPSRTAARDGIRNADWWKTLGADGHQSAVEPGNPNITYAETQQGGLHRIDQITGEQVYIQPQPGEGEGPERFNWDAPILVSPHAPNRLYFASHRVWRSEDRGDSWTAISGDLTRDEDRMQMPLLGQTWSWDAQWDFNAMSVYSTITSLAESPLQAGVVYAGTDDGIVQVTEDGGANWRKIEVKEMPGVPATAFVNDIKADLHDANTVYVSLDNHKYGDFTPYLVKSTDRGKTWKSITGNIPDRHLIWRMVQDHETPELLFAATEFGIYVTLDGGDYWKKLAGSPTIPFRDITIQRRENDLVGASFGRGFFVLDDYAPLREVSESLKDSPATILSSRAADWYMPRSMTGSQGSAHYAAPNPAFGAVFTYYLSEGLETKASMRKKAEKEALKADKDIAFPSWDELEAERRQEQPKIWLTIKDQEGNVVRRMNGPSRKGMHRVAWDFRRNGKNGISLRRGSGNRWRGGGFMALPGDYTLTISKEVDGKITQLTEPRAFKVERLYKGALPAQEEAKIDAFRVELEDFIQEMSAVNYMMNQSMNKVAAMQTALTRLDEDKPDMVSKLYDLKQELYKVDEAMNGNRSKGVIGERTKPTISSRMFVAYRGMGTTYGPTENHKNSFAVAQKELKSVKAQLESIAEEMKSFENSLQAAGAPWIEGQAMPKKN